MPRGAWWVRLVVAVGVAATGFYAVRGRGLRGGSEAGALAFQALQRLSFQPIGDAEVSLEGDHGLAWALERSVKGAAGQWLARGEGGAVRWRVRFAGGGEAVITPTGTLWSVSRPLPTDPGPDLFPPDAVTTIEEALEQVVTDPRSWAWRRTQTWREGGHTRYRARFEDEGGVLPRGWRREVEMDLVGSTVVSARRWVLPLGTDLGVVRGRMAELSHLRIAGLVGLAIITVGIILAGTEAYAYHERLAVARGIMVGGLALVLARQAGLVSPEIMVGAFAAGIAVALLPTWAHLPVSRARWGVVGGVVLAYLAISAPEVVSQIGGWLPRTPPLPADPSPVSLFARSWLPALVEEPILRGALPGLLMPFLGWWGAGLVGALAGAVLHPVPSVPMVASLGLELLLQLGMVVVARYSGVRGAVVARGTLVSIVDRGGYPLGLSGDLVAMSGVLLGVVLLILPRRNNS